MEASAVTGDAQYLVSRIRQTGQAELSKRDLHRLSKFRKVADLDDPVELLVSHGYLALLPAGSPSPAGGRPPSARYAVHPDLVRGVDT